MENLEYRRRKNNMENSNFVNRLNGYLMKDSSFMALIIAASSAIFAGTYLFITFGTGVFSDIPVAAMLSEGLNGGSYAAAAGFAAGFLIARVLEGPLVGILDIGGALLTGVGIGVPALMLSVGFTLPFDNFGFSLISGALIGLVLGAVIMIVRKFVPAGVSVGGTSIMMGAGNATGRWLGPLIIIAATNYNVYAGIGAVIGGALFYKAGRSMTGGAILGAMILGAIFIT